MSIRTDVSVGEFLDKLTILQIKLERIQDPDKRENIRREYDLLNQNWAGSVYSGIDPGESLTALRRVNESLWDIEDRIREKEARSEFDADFIELARSVYLINDERAAIKRRLNEQYGSGLVEEKSYAPYRRDQDTPQQ